MNHPYKKFLRKFQFSRNKEFWYMGKFVFWWISYFGEKLQKIIIFTQNHHGNHYQAQQMWSHLVGNLISFHMIPLSCIENVLFKHYGQITKYKFKMAAILKKAPSRKSSQDTACLPQIFLFPTKNWSRKTTWDLHPFQVTPTSLLAWSI